MNNTSEIKPLDEQDKRCAPGLIFEDGSCIRLKVLTMLATAYNQENENKIQLEEKYEVLNPKEYKKHIIRELSARLNKIPQRLWSKQPFAKRMKDLYKEELMKHTFRPDGPNGKFEWLNTVQIDKVMEQYENKYNDFKFLGAVPIDFDDFDEFGIRTLDYEQLIKDGKIKLGVVFNLDKHNQPGSHWVAMYANLQSGEIYYFDSYGIKPCKRIEKFMRRVAKISETSMNVKNITLESNKYQHQRENSECGVYSMNFILRMLRGDNFVDICKSVVPDKKINKCRNVYFHNANV